MIDIAHFRHYVVKPTLDHIGMYSNAAEELVVGTALVESQLTYLHQIGGPAVGLYQVEPATHTDVWENFLRFDQRLFQKVIVLKVGLASQHDEMAWNLRYATAIARLVYWRDAEPLPEAWDVDSLAAYWKRVFNTELGKGDPAKFVELYRRHA